MGARNLAGYESTLGSVSFENIGVDPPTEGGGDTVPTLYFNDSLTFRDTSGVRFPVIVGADGAGVKVITVADSPYTVAETDRLLLPDTTDGQIVVKLPADGGPVVGRDLIIADAKRMFGTNFLGIDGNGNDISGDPTRILSTDGAAIWLDWTGDEWTIVASANTAEGLVAHAPTHRAGGSDDLLSAPGEIGGGTPNVVNVTKQRVHTSSIPSAEANKTLIYSFAANQLTQLHSGGMKITDVAGAVSLTAEARRQVAVFSLTAGATKDFTIGGGGAARISAAGATGSTGAFFTFADNGATSTNGLTFTDFATSDTPLKLCAYSGGAGTLRVKNNLASGTAKVVLDLTEGAAV